MKQIRSKLKDKKEKKLKYDYKYIESLIEQFLIDYDIDAKMEIYIDEKVKIINFNEAYENIIKPKPKKDNLQFQVGFFLDIKDYFEKLIHESIEKELNDINGKVPEDEYEKISEILYNSLDEIQLTMFDEGIKRSTLVSYHYLLKVLQKHTAAYLEVNSYKKIKGIKNPNELLSLEIYNVISTDKELVRFVLTLKNLIEQWLIKYTNNTKIGDFYYDILMITPDFIIEKILKYLSMIAIRNKNPMTLRAIFSSYITLIHKNLFSYYAANLSKVKIGYFKQLEVLFNENFDLNSETSSDKFLFETMFKLYIMKNKRLIKDDINILEEPFFNSFFESNPIDICEKYNLNENVHLLDHLFMYNSSLKLLKTDNKIANAKVISSTYVKNSFKKKNALYIQEKLSQKLYSYFYNIIEDKDSVLQIIEAMAKDIYKKINFDNYLDEDFNPVSIVFDDYLKSIDLIIDKISKVIINNELSLQNINIIDNIIDSLNKKEIL